MAKKKKKNKSPKENRQKTPETAEVIENIEAADVGDEYADAERRAKEALEALDESERAEIIAAPDVTVPKGGDISEEDVAESLKALRGEDIKSVEIAEQRPKKKKKKKLSLIENIIMLTVFVICAAVLVVSLITLTKSSRDKKAGEQVYNNTDFDRFVFGETNDSFNHPGPLTMLDSDPPMLTLYERILRSGETVSNTSSQYSKKLDAMRASLTALKSKNKEVYGWIYVENTVIDHPIMRGSDNNYYLDHAYTGESLPIGSIFIDSTAEDKLTDNYNSVIYGHNVVDVAGSKSSMFHDITKFFDESFFAENKIYIYTMDGVFIFKPVSVYTTTYDSEFYRFIFNSEEDFVSFANAALQQSKIPSGESFTTGDRMLSLYTCTNGVNNFRYVLHAKLVETIQ